MVGLFGGMLTGAAVRVVFVLGSTALSLLVVMLSLNIITVDEAATILNLSPEAEAVFRSVISRVQEVTGNILDIISQLLTKLFGWAGVDVDLNQIHIDVNKDQNPADANQVQPAPDLNDLKPNNN